MHDAADLWFEKRFGIRYRSQALFVTSLDYIASAYADNRNHVVRIVPLGAYKYCWSPVIADMLMISVGLQSADKLDELLANGDYRESDLQSAHDSGHEVMVFCEQYITIPIHLIGDGSSSLFDGPASEASVILPAF